MRRSTLPGAGLLLTLVLCGGLLVGCSDDEDRVLGPAAADEEEIFANPHASTHAGSDWIFATSLDGAIEVIRDY